MVRRFCSLASKQSKVLKKIWYVVMRLPCKIWKYGLLSVCTYDIIFIIVITFLKFKRER